MSENTEQMTVEEANRRANALKEEFTAIQGKLDNKFDDVIKLMKSLINSTKYVEAIRWAQYVPSFNDGDPCVFQVNELELKLDLKCLSLDEKVERDLTDNDGWVWNFEAIRILERQTDVLNFETTREIETAVNAFNNIHNLLGSNLKALENAFGTNVTVVVTKKGIYIETYNENW